ncbi:tail fiber protein [Xanthomonas phage vB_XooS_NR08]|nr:tail fiber protein [Xanthomonas phage vB_XooS_NR08]
MDKLTLTRQFWIQFVSGSYANNLLASSKAKSVFTISPQVRRRNYRLYKYFTTLVCCQ